MLRTQSMSLSSKTRRCECAGAARKWGGRSTGQLVSSALEENTNRWKQGPTHVVLCHLEHAQLCPGVGEPAIVLVELLALLGWRLEVVDVAHGDPPPLQDVARVLRQLLGREDDEWVPRPVLSERVLQDQGPLEVARLGEQGGPGALGLRYVGRRHGRRGGGECERDPGPV